MIWILLLLHLISTYSDNKSQDYYSILGISTQADEKQIRSAYRKLAKIHHPDKHKGADKTKHEAIFREIVQAYETLSDPLKREEYDLLLSSGSSHTSTSPEQTHYYQRSHDYYTYQQKFNEYDDVMEDLLNQMYHFYEQQNSHSSFQPELTGSYLPAGEVIYPLSPIMTSDDRSHFALLDVSCSFVVYKGSIEDYVYSMMYSTPSDIMDISAHEVFRSPSAYHLHGQCFAGLDFNGELKVFAGHPSQPNYYPVWSTTNEDKDYAPAYYKRYFIELSNSGEVSVRMLAAGSSEEVCVWSSRSCNRLAALAIRTFRGILPNIASLSTMISRLITYLIQRIHGFISCVERKVFSVLDFIFPDSEIRSQGKKRSENHRQKSYYQF